MARTHAPPDISRLAGFINEPYQQDRVIEAARALGYPFTLSEIVTAVELPGHTVHRVLDRLIKAGVLTRTRMQKTYPQLCAGRKRVFIPGGKQRRVYLYSFVDAA